MAWFHLLVAAAFEVAFAMGMKFSNGFGRLWPSLLTVVAAIGGIYFLTLALCLALRRAADWRSASPIRSGPRSARWARCSSASCCLAKA